MNATVNNETCAIEFHAIAGNGKPLLGRKSATELGLLELPYGNMFVVVFSSMLFRVFPFSKVCLSIALIDEPESIRKLID
jgi:hypothetical protein